MREVWKSVKGYEGLYKVSNLGRVKSIPRPKTTGGILKPFKRAKYLSVDLRKINKRKTFQVHRMVAEAFIPNPNNLEQVNHKDGNKLNNVVDNLEWCTCSENVKHAYKNQLMKARKGIKNTRSKKVYQYDLNANLIKVWDSLGDIQRALKVEKSAIAGVCRKERKTAYGYIWRY